MDKKEKAKEIASIIFKFIWILFATTMWSIGLWFFTGSFETEDVLAMFFVWGGLCAVCNISDVLRNAFNQGKRGARSGANNYTVSGDGYGNVTIQNHPFRDAILGFIGGIIGGLIIGPILIPIKVIRAIIDAIKMIIDLKKAA